MDSYLCKTRIHSIMQRACIKLVTPGNESASEAFILYVYVHVLAYIKMCVCVCVCGNCSGHLTV